MGVAGARELPDVKELTAHGIDHRCDDEIQLRVRRAERRLTPAPTDNLGRVARVAGAAGDRNLVAVFDHAVENGFQTRRG